MTHTIIFLTKFSQRWLQLLFWRNFARYIHAILFLEHNKWRRLRNSVRIGNQSCFWLKHLFWLYPMKKGEQSEVDWSAFLHFPVQLSWIMSASRDLLTKDRPLDTSERLMDVSIFALECVMQQSLKARCINRTQSDSTENYLLSICGSCLPCSGEKKMNKTKYSTTKNSSSNVLQEADLFESVDKNV